MSVEEIKPEREKVIDLCRFRLVKSGNCKHSRIVVSKVDRTLSCASCGIALDAFDLVYDIAVRENSWYQSVHALQAEAKRVGGKVAKLKKIEARLRQRVYRGVKDPELKTFIQELLSLRG